MFDGARRKENRKNVVGKKRHESEAGKEKGKQGRRKERRGRELEKRGSREEGRLG